VAKKVNHIGRILNDIEIQTIIRIKKGILFKEILNVETQENVSFIVIASH
jgi:hypothetical protein